MTAKPLDVTAPSGTRVFVVEDMGSGVTLTRTRSAPWVLEGKLVVLLEGRSGGYLLERCFDATLVFAEERARSEALWQLLDNIDTASDATKGDYEAFYAVAMKMVRQRHLHLVSRDGQTLVDPSL